MLGYPKQHQKISIQLVSQRSKRSWISLGSKPPRHEWIYYSGDTRTSTLSILGLVASEYMSKKTTLRNQLRILKNLIKRGADVNLHLSLKGFFNVLAGVSRPEVAQFLLSQGADTLYIEYCEPDHRLDESEYAYSRYIFINQLCVMPVIIGIGGYKLAKVYIDHQIHSSEPKNKNPRQKK